jgi:hypothetical protein
VRVSELLRAVALASLVGAAGHRGQERGGAQQSTRKQTSAESSMHGRDLPSVSRADDTALTA